MKRKTLSSKIFSAVLAFLFVFTWIPVTNVHVHAADEGSAGGVEIATAELPDATVGVAYSLTLSATPAGSTFFWNIRGLPAGLTADFSGNITGTPTAAGSYTVSISVGSTGGGSAAKDMTLVVNPAALQEFTVSVAPNQSYLGSVTGDGTYSEGDRVTLTATTNIDIGHFAYWLDNSVELPEEPTEAQLKEAIVSYDSAYTFTADKDISLTAVFGYIPYSYVNRIAYESADDMFAEEGGGVRIDEADISVEIGKQSVTVLPSDYDKYVTLGGVLYERHSMFSWHYDETTERVIYETLDSFTVPTAPIYNSLEYWEYLSEYEKQITVAYLLHTHSFATEHNDTHHWDECSCGEKGDEIAHSYSDDADATCDCGYTRTIEHTHSFTREHDDTYHWEECACGARQNEGVHGWIIVERSADRHYQECSDCLLRIATEHSLTKEYNDTHHWNVCSSCAIDLARREHSLVEGSCSCGYSRTISMSFSALNEATVGEEYSFTFTATSLNGGVLFWNVQGLPAGLRSNASGVISGTPTAEGTYQVTVAVGSTAGGSYSASYTLVVNAPHVHNYSAATCAAPAKCSCGATTGEKNPDNHTGGTELRNQKDATEFEDGYTGDLYCLGCDALLEEGETVAATHVHSYTTEHNDTHHWEECACGEKGDEIAHSYSDDADATCDCGFGRHVHTYETKYDENGHWTECACGDKIDAQPHKFNLETVLRCDCGYTHHEVFEVLAGGYDPDRSEFEWHRPAYGISREEIEATIAVLSGQQTVDATVKVKFYNENEVPAGDAEKIRDYANANFSGKSYGVEWMEISVTGEDGKRISKLDAPLSFVFNASGRKVLGVASVHDGELIPFVRFDDKHNIFVPKTTHYTKNHIFEQAAQALLAHANTVPVGALSMDFSTYAIIYEVEPTPDTPSSPQTGDNTNMALWFALLLLSGGAEFAVYWFGFRKKRAI